MRNIVFIFSLLALVSCGKNGKDGTNGLDGATSMGLNGSDAVSTGVDFADIEPGLACANGGISIFTFRDENSDGLMQSEEQIIKVKAICNGLNGTNGTNGVSPSITLESVSSSATCPNGGVKVYSSSSSPVEICNGINGLNGEQGIQGIQGIPGIAGTNGIDGIDGQNGVDGQNGAPGTNVIPVKFCPNDSSSHPEYGLLIGNELFAVYWGTTPPPQSKPQAFLTKLNSGSYQSTGGSNCIFTVP